MLHLAQVQSNPSSERKEIHLLAVQQSEDQWQVNLGKFIPIEDYEQLKLGTLVLVELDAHLNILKIQDATSWILDLVQHNLSAQRVALEFFEEEQIRLKKWEQELALKHKKLQAKKIDIEELELEVERLQERLDNS